MTTPATLTGVPMLRRQLDDGLSELNINVDAAKRDKLMQYVALLDKWNKVYNLTAVREPERMIALHILDSLTVLPHLGGAIRILDVGTGGGLPGVPLAIANPALRVTMLDAVAKKTTFVRQVIGEIGIANANVVAARVEDIPKLPRYDCVISRAFAELRDFIDAAGHLCAEDGAMLAMKGVFPHDEIGRIPEGFSATEIIALKVPGLDAERHLVVIRKKSGGQ